jgi:hypothetical protein
MHVQVRTPDGRIYDVDLADSALVCDLQTALFHPNPVPRNSSVMARTRLLDPRERVANVAHNDLFLVGPKPEAVNAAAAATAAQAASAASPPPAQRQPHALGPRSRSGNGRDAAAHEDHHQQQHRRHHRPHESPEAVQHAKAAVEHLAQFVASPPTEQQPVFGAASPPPPPPLPPHYQQQQQQQQQQQPNDNRRQEAATPPPPAQSPKPAAAAPRSHAEVLTELRAKYEDMLQRTRDPATTQHMRLLINEDSMRLLYKLDELTDIDAELKPVRKQLVKDVQAMQDDILARGKAQ